MTRPEKVSISLDRILAEYRAIHISQDFGILCYGRSITKHQRYFIYRAMIISVMVAAMEMEVVVNVLIFLSHGHMMKIVMEIYQTRKRV